MKNKILLLLFLANCGVQSQVEQSNQAESKVVVSATSKVGTQAIWMTNYTTRGFLGSNRHHYACVYYLESNDDKLHWHLQPRNKEEKKTNPKRGLIEFLRYRAQNGATTRYLRTRPLELGGMKSTLKNDLPTALRTLNIDYVNLFGSEVSPIQGGLSLMKQGSTVLVLYNQKKWNAYLSDIVQETKRKEFSLLKRPAGPTEINPALAPSTEAEVLESSLLLANTELKITEAELAAAAKSVNKLKSPVWRLYFLTQLGAVVANSWVYYNGLDTENKAEAGTKLMISSDIASNSVKVWSRLRAKTAMNTLVKAVRNTEEKWLHPDPDVKCLPPDLLANVIEKGEWDESQNPFHRKL